MYMQIGGYHRNLLLGADICKGAEECAALARPPQHIRASLDAACLEALLALRNAQRDAAAPERVHYAGPNAGPLAAAGDHGDGAGACGDARANTACGDGPERLTAAEGSEAATRTHSAAASQHGHLRTAETAWAAALHSAFEDAKRLKWTKQGLTEHEDEGNAYERPCERSVHPRNEHHLPPTLACDRPGSSVTARHKVCSPTLRGAKLPHSLTGHAPVIHAAFALKYFTDVCRR